MKEGIEIQMRNVDNYVKIEMVKSPFIKYVYYYLKILQLRYIC